MISWHLKFFEHKYTPFCIYLSLSFLDFFSYFIISKFTHYINVFLGFWNKKQDLLSNKHISKKMRNKTHEIKNDVSLRLIITTSTYRNRDCEHSSPIIHPVQLAADCTSCQAAVNHQPSLYLCLGFKCNLLIRSMIVGLNQDF